MGDTSTQEGHNWFWRLNQRVLRSYAARVDLPYLTGKYPGLSRGEIARQRINTHARWGGLVGLLSGTAITLAEAGFVISALGSFFTLFAASPVTVPTMAVTLPIGIIAFLLEVAFILRIQLHLAYELFLLYDIPADPENAAEIRDIAQVAFGIKGAELAGQAVQRMLPQLGDELVRRAVRSPAVTRPVERWVERRLTWQFARKYLGQGGLVRILVPGMAIFTATAWDFLSTKSIGHTLHNRIEWREMAALEPAQLNLEPISHPQLLLRAVFSLAVTNRDLGMNSLRFYQGLAQELGQQNGDPGLAVPQDISLYAWDRVMADLVDVDDPAERQSIYDVMTTSASVEGKLSRRKKKRLQQLAQAYGLPFDFLRLKAQMGPYKEPAGGRTCLYMVLAAFLLMLYTCLICGLSAVWLPTLVQNVPDWVS